MEMECLDTDVNLEETPHKPSPCIALMNETDNRAERPRLEEIIMPETPKSMSEKRRVQK